jgi:hypothetical protein
MILKNFIEYQIHRILFEDKVGDKLTETNFGTNISLKPRFNPPKIKEMKLLPPYLDS